MARFGSLTFGSIGAGNMAEAIVRGLIENDIISPASITLSDPNPDAQKKFASLGVNLTSDNATACAANIVLLAVKPQVLPQVLSSCAANIQPGSLLISIAAGVRLASIATELPSGVKLIRVMPNTPLLVGKGASCIAAGDGCEEQDIHLALEIFGACGLALRVEEEELDAVTALSGSGPAYVFRFCELLAQAGAELGLSPALANTLARQTIVGAAKMLATQPDSASALREKVTSPGGTTAAALDTFATMALDKTVHSALNSAYHRSLELGGREVPGA